jgi:hypothetical protein
MKEGKDHLLDLLGFFDDFIWQMLKTGINEQPIEVIHQLAAVN